MTNYLSSGTQRELEGHLSKQNYEMLSILNSTHKKRKISVSAVSQETVGTLQETVRSQNAYQQPAVEANAEGEVEGGEKQQSSEALQQERDQAHLEHVRVEHHQQDDDHVEQDGDVLDTAISFGN